MLHQHMVSVLIQLLSLFGHARQVYLPLSNVSCNSSGCEARYSFGGGKTYTILYTVPYLSCPRVSSYWCRELVTDGTNLESFLDKSYRSFFYDQMMCPLAWQSPIALTFIVLRITKGRRASRPSLVLQPNWLDPPWFFSSRHCA